MLRAFAAVALVVLGACLPPPAARTPAARVAAPSAAPARAVDVRAVGPDGAGVSEVRVCASRFAAEGDCATTDASGHATVNVVPGVYALRASPPEGARLRQGVVTLDLSAASHAVVTLEGRASISGSLRDQRGDAVAWAPVCAHDTQSGEVTCVHSAGDGTFKVGVHPGIQKIEARHPLGTRLMTEWAIGDTGSTWSGGERGEDEAAAFDTRTADVTGVHLVMLDGVELSGVVTGAPDGRPVEDAQVCTYPFRAPLGWECGRTDKEGRYSFLRYPDTYWVWAIPPGERGSRLMYVRYENVLQGVDATPFDLRTDRTLSMRLPEGVVLRGRISDPDGRPVRLALVCLDTPFPTGRICRTTGSEGTYEIATRPETYVLQVIPPEGSDLTGGYWPDSARDWTGAGEIRVGAAGATADMTLRRGVRLTGQVRDARGVPLGGATINIGDASGPRYFASTDAAGHYAVALPVGSYAVDVFAPLASSSISVIGEPLDVGGDVRYDIVLPDVPPEGLSGP